MQRFILVFCFCASILALQAQLVNRFSVDLTKSKKGKIAVACEVPAYGQKTLIYQIPRVVPGSYSIKNYSDYVSEFRAYDANGKKLKVNYDSQKGCFTIVQAKSLARLEYDVKETWTDGKSSDYVFQPGGTYFEPNTLYCLNTFAVFGYFDGFLNTPTEIRIKKDAALYCSTSADIKSISSTEDVVKAPDYNTLQDNPLVYLHPDTISVQVKNCRFHIAVFSRNHKITAQKILTSVEPVLQKAFTSFFSAFPIENYTFTFLCPGWQDSNLMGAGGMGAMEHRMSSVYFYPETGNSDILDSFLKHVIAHEFLHVLTPLSLKSEQVYGFNYQNPQASQHLWLYEGGIEYLSNLILYQNSIFNENEYWENIREKSIYSGRYKDISMTGFSKHIFENTDMMYYANVYNRGALVSLLFDIRINELTGGRMNLKKVLLQLEEKYRGRYFNDDGLFDEIVGMTHPDLRAFIDDYIVGTKELPLQEYLHKIGYQFSSQKPDSIYTFGRVSVEFDAKEKRCVVRDASPDYNAFGLDKGDVLLAVNGVALAEENYYRYAKLIGNPETDAGVSVRFVRKGKIAEVKNPAIKVKVTQLNYIEPDVRASEVQMQLRKMVLGR